MAYKKKTWVNDETITVEALNNIEGGIAGVELTPGPKGDKGETGAKGAAGTAGKDGVGITKLELTTSEDGKVTGGTLTKSDGSSAAVTVTVA